MGYPVLFILAGRADKIQNCKGGGSASPSPSPPRGEANAGGEGNRDRSSAMGVPLIFLAPPPNYVKEQLRQGGGVPLPIRGASEALSGALCLLAAFGLVLAAPVPVSRDAFPYGTAALSPCFAFPFSAPSPSERRLSPFPVGTGGGRLG